MPGVITRCALCGRGYRLLGTKPLTKLQGVGRAILNALPAGHAFFGIDHGTEIGTDCVRCFKECRNAHGEAGAVAAVAYSRGFAKPVSVRHFVHQTVILSKFQNFFRFLAADLPAAAGTYVIFRSGTHLDANVFFQMSASIVHYTA